MASSVSSRTCFNPLSVGASGKQTTSSVFLVLLSPPHKLAFYPIRRRNRIWNLRTCIRGLAGSIRGYGRRILSLRCSVPGNLCWSVSHLPAAIRSYLVERDGMSDMESVTSVSGMRIFLYLPAFLWWNYGGGWELMVEGRSVFRSDLGLHGLDTYDLLRIRSKCPDNLWKTCVGGFVFNYNI